MRDTVEAQIRLRWWLRWYLASLILTCRVTGMQPDWDRVECWIRRGLVAQSNAHVESMHG